ncbi:SH3 domain-containing protein [Mesorhizobium sp.]|uniref:SH3 domain-containing protein n=1 Tax=Mesorhizobium sp. TaxID=1871066 RepID=UPI0025FD4E19|nr:SH3 domain-containing protein [Mesorhizobium sp.]
MIARGEAGDWQGTDGLIRFIAANSDQGISASPREFVISVDPVVREDLGWPADLPAETAANRALVDAMIARGEASDWQGTDGLIRFIAANSGQGISASATQFITSVDPVVRKDLDWPANLPAETAANRALVDAMIARGEAGGWQGTDGLIRFIAANSDQGISASPTQFVTSLDPAVRKDLDWPANLPTETAANRALVDAMIARGEAGDWQGIDGLIRFIAANSGQGISANPRQFVRSLDPVVRKDLDWPAHLPAETAANRALVDAMIARGEAGDWQGTGGLIRFTAANNDQGISASPREFVRSLDLVVRENLNWPAPLPPLRSLRKLMREMNLQIANLHFRAGHVAVDGVEYRVALDDQDRIIDWFTGSGLPRRLQRFSGRIIGYSVSDDLDALVIRLRAPLGFAAYSFGGRVEQQFHTIEATIQDGVPTAFRLWDAGTLRATLTANNTAVLGEMPSASPQYLGDEVEFEPLDPSEPPEDRAERQVLALKVQDLLNARYGDDEAQVIIASIARWHELVEDDGASPEDAYAQIADEFALSKEQLLTYMSDLRVHLGQAGLGAEGFRSEDAITSAAQSVASRRGDGQGTPGAAGVNKLPQNGEPDPGPRSLSGAYHPEGAPYQQRPSSLPNAFRRQEAPKPPEFLPTSSFGFPNGSSITPTAVTRTAMTSIDPAALEISLTSAGVSRETAQAIAVDMSRAGGPSQNRGRQPKASNPLTRREVLAIPAKDIKQFAMAGLEGGDIRLFTRRQAAQFTDRQLLDLSEAGLLAYLTRPQLEAIIAGPNGPYLDVAGLDPKQVPWLRRMENLTEEQWLALSNAGLLTYLTRPQQQAIPDRMIPYLDLAGLKPKWFRHGQIAKLTPDQWDTFTINDIEPLTRPQIEAITPTQFRDMGPGLFPMFTDKHFDRMGKDQKNALSLPQLMAFLATHENNLTPAQTTEIKALLKHARKQEYKWAALAVVTTVASSAGLATILPSQWVVTVFATAAGIRGLAYGAQSVLPKATEPHTPTARFINWVVAGTHGVTLFGAPMAAWQGIGRWKNAAFTISQAIGSAKATLEASTGRTALHNAAVRVAGPLSIFGLSAGTVQAWPSPGLTVIYGALTIASGRLWASDKRQGAANRRPPPRTDADRAAQKKADARSLKWDRIVLGVGISLPLMFGAWLTLTGQSEDNNEAKSDGDTLPPPNSPSDVPQAPETPPEQFPQLVVLAEDGLNMRAQPAIESEKVTAVKPGTFIEQTGKPSISSSGQAWIPVAGFGADGGKYEGWVAAENVKAHVEGASSPKGRTNPTLEQGSYQWVEAQDGDSIRLIAKTNSADVAATVMLNMDHILNPAQIFPGDRIYLPPGQENWKLAS